MSLSCVSFLLLLGLFCEMRKQWVWPNDIFLLAWVFVFVGMMAVVMSWVAVRYLIIVVPPVVFLGVRLAEIMYSDKARWVFAWVGASLFVLSFSVAYADYNQAQSARRIVHELKTRGLSD